MYAAQEAPSYRPLMGHASHESLRRYMLNADTYVELVGIIGHAAPMGSSRSSNNSSKEGSSRQAPVSRPVPRWVYMWVVVRLDTNNEHPGAWMTRVRHGVMRSHMTAVDGLYIGVVLHSISHQGCLAI